MLPLLICAVPGRPDSENEKDSSTGGGSTNEVDGVGAIVENVGEFVSDGSGVRDDVDERDVDEVMLAGAPCESEAVALPVPVVEE